MATNKLSTSTKVQQSKSGLSFASANPNEFPIAYQDELWDNVDEVTQPNLTALLGGAAQYDQHTINEALAASIGGTGDSLTEEQLTLLQWVRKHRQDLLQEEAQAKFAVATSVSGKTFDASVKTNTTMKVTVTTKFDGVLIDVTDNYTTDGWTRTAVGTYEKTLANASEGTIAAHTFSLTLPNDHATYAGITVTGTSAAHSISAIYPTFYGFANSKNQAALNTVVLSLSKSTNNVNENKDWNNTTGADAYFWVLAKGSANFYYNGNNEMLEEPITGVSFTAPNADITLSGYKLYFSKNSAAAGLGFSSSLLKINL